MEIVLVLVVSALGALAIIGAIAGVKAARKAGVPIKAQTFFNMRHVQLGVGSALLSGVIVPASTERYFRAKDILDFILSTEGVVIMLFVGFGTALIARAILHSEPRDNQNAT